MLPYLCLFTSSGRVELLSLIPINMASGRAKPNMLRQCLGSDDRGGVLGIYLRCWNSPQRSYQPSQSPSERKNIQRRAGIFFPSYNQRRKGRRRKCLHCSSCHIQALTRLRHNTVLRSIRDNPRLLEHGNKGDKNSNLDIFPHGLETSLRRSDHEPRPKAALLR